MRVTVRGTKTSLPAWEEAVKTRAEPTTFARPRSALPHVVIRLPSFKRRSNVDLTRVAEEETNAARSATEVEREDARRDSATAAAGTAGMATAGFIWIRPGVGRVS